MAIQKTEAIVLRTLDFRETSLIVNFFTKDFGKISGLIKGIRNNPQRYGGLPLSFSQNAIVFYEKPHAELNLVTQCDAQDQFLSIRQNLTKTNFAHYFIELLDAVTFDFDKNEALFSLITDSLQALAQDRALEQIARTFEIKLLKLSGFKPRLDTCVHCQKDIVEAARFSSLLGGMLCAYCFTQDRTARGMLKGTLASIDYIEKANWQKALALKLSANIASELKITLSRFLNIHLEKEIKSQKFLN
ncbi:DNA repair protein RecO [Candidatus Omnitrophota bacterium]